MPSLPSGVTIAGVRSLVETLVHKLAQQSRVPFAVRFADGRETRYSSGDPAFTLSFRRTRAYWRTAVFGHVGLLESYFDGDLDIDGSLPKALEAGMEAGVDSPNLLLRGLNRLHEFLHSNSSWLRAKHNAEFHYALGPDFYRFWLDDPLMLYTCAYWSDGTRTLEEAQRNKLDHVARKVLLKPGDDVVDIGSGFGGFLQYAEERFGVKVTGYNTTRSQVEHARRQIEFKRLKNTVAVEGDFRSMDRQFDKVVSIGCLEHAGRDGLTDLIRAHARSLKPGGLGLIHFIGHIGQFETDYFIRKYVFPGGWIPSLADVIVEMEKAGLEVLDVENLRRHYALTLDAWGERFDQSWEKIRALDPARFNERFRRIWRTYLYGCAEMFRSRVGRTHLFQVAFAKGNVTTASYPMGREFLYEQPAPAEKRSSSRAA
ncbi:MAG: cyclopropane-fatty-acyl-phospholipid synthase [Betaproteobacteria bacterium]|jgi:cyclopropane-fatty-acyl-phospholipid synthase|nr:cyclopropane-fatty-acyl-phospholipid synthase [Betaproteobacteria bacterium]